MLHLKVGLIKHVGVYHQNGACKREQMFKKRNLPVQKDLKEHSKVN
jgi:hypothetical protein